MKRKYLNAYYIIALVAIASLFVGCKKDKSDTLNNTNVSVSLDPIRVISADSKTNTYEYAFTGKVIAPRKVKIMEYGFIISPGGVSSYTVSMQASEIIGSIGINRSSSVPIFEGNVVFYIILENGEIIRSDGQIIENSTALKLALPNEGQNGDGGTNEYFTGILTNNNTAYWGVEQYTVEYMPAANYPGGTATVGAFSTMPNQNLASYPISYKLPIDGVNMIYGNDYYYRLVFVAVHSGVTPQTFKGQWHFFTAQ